MMTPRDLSIAMMPSQTVLIAAVTIWLPLPLIAQLSHTDRILEDANIRAEVESIRGYLESLQPNHDASERTRELIHLLGSDLYEQRESALQQLRAMPVVPARLLNEAKLHSDPEIRWRAARLFPVQPHNRRVLWAVLITIREDQLSGLAQELFETMLVYANDEQVQRLARRALRVTAGKADEEILRSGMSDDAVVIRIAATETYAEIFGRQSLVALTTPLQDSDDRVRLAAAIGLANGGARSALPALVDLLSSADFSVRSGSITALRELTGKTFGFVAYAGPAQRERGIARWKRWMDREGADFEFERRLDVDGRREIGRTLVSHYGPAFVVELDADGNELRRLTGYRGPWGATRLDNGNILVNWYDSHCVVEYDEKGEEVWKFENEMVRHPWSAEPTSQGNVVIAFSRSVIEVDRETQIVRNIQFPAMISHALRLDNGHLLVAIMDGENGRVQEIDNEEQVVIERRGLSHPYRIQRLENGNTLVVERGANRIIEISPDMQTIVWSFNKQLNSPDSAQRLSNGNTLISDANHIYEVTLDGEIISKHPTTQCIVWRY